MKTPTSITWRADGEANLYTLFGEGGWIGRVQFNGALLVEQQEHILTRIGIAMDPPTEADPIRGEARMQRTISRLSHTNGQLRGSVEHHQQKAREADFWRHQMPEDKARSILSSRHFDYAVKEGRDYCDRMQRAAWDANQPEKYGAYGAAGRLAVPREFQGL